MSSSKASKVAFCAEFVEMLEFWGAILK